MEFLNTILKGLNELSLETHIEKPDNYIQCRIPEKNIWFRIFLNTPTLKFMMGAEGWVVAYNEKSYGPEWSNVSVQQLLKRIKYYLENPSNLIPIQEEYLRVYYPLRLVGNIFREYGFIEVNPVKRPNDNAKYFINAEKNEIRFEYINEEGGFLNVYEGINWSSLIVRISNSEEDDRMMKDFRLLIENVLEE